MNCKIPDLEFEHATRNTIRAVQVFERLYLEGREQIRYFCPKDELPKIGQCIRWPMEASGPIWYYIVQAVKKVGDPKGYFQHIVTASRWIQ